MTSPKAEEWTEENCIQLIREFRARPILWDPKDPFFFKKALKPAAWEEIGKIINHDADSCKHKMVVLMSSFRREKAKIMHSLADKNIDDLGSAYKSTWFAFKEMAFLMDKENERKRQLLGDNIDDEDTPSIKKVIMQHYIAAPVNKGALHKKSPKILTRRRTAVEFREEVSSTPPPAQIPQAKPISPIPTPSVPPPIPTPTQTASERDEEIKSFISFIGNKMKKYTDETKNAVQQAICEIIFKADQHLYDNSVYEKYTIVDSEGDPFKEHNFETPNIKTQILYSDSD